MKTKEFIVEVYHREAELNHYYSIELPDYFNTEALSSILNPCTKYQLKVYYKSTFEYHMESICSDWTDKDTKDNVILIQFTLEELIENIKKVKLYKKVQKPAKGDTVLEIKKFKLPKCVKVTAETISHPCSGNTITYIRTSIICANCPTMHDALCRDLGCRYSCVGNYYLLGVWEVLRDLEDSDTLIGIKWEEKTVTEDVELDR